MINVAIGQVGRVVGFGIEAIQAARVARGALAVTDAAIVATKAAGMISNGDAVVSSGGAARAAAREFLGPGAEPIPDRVTGAFRGWKSEGGTRIVIDTHANAVGEHMNFLNKTVVVICT